MEREEGGLGFKIMNNELGLGQIYKKKSDTFMLMMRSQLLSGESGTYVVEREYRLGLCFKIMNNMLGPMGSKI